MMQASVEDLVLVHAPDYVDRFKTGRMTPSEIRNLGLPHSEQLVKHVAFARVQGCRLNRDLA